MKKSILALALALTLVGTLAACSYRDPNTGGPGSNSGTTSGTNGSNGMTGSGSVSGSTSGSTSGTAGTVSRRYSGASAYNSSDYFQDGRYTAGSNGHVYSRDGNTVSRDLTRDARDIVRDAGGAIGDAGRDIGDMMTGNDTYSGTPSWEPDSSAVRY